jgi:hypothetical protein
MILGIIGLLYPIVGYVAFLLGFITLVTNGVITNVDDAFLRNVGIGVLFFDAVLSTIGVIYRYVG